MFISEVSEGESLSSWMYRITLQTMCNRNFDASHIGEFETGEMWTNVTLSSTGDPDFLDTNRKLPSFIKHHSVTREYLTEKFGPCEQPLVPIQYRRSYCYACLEEGLKTTRSFVCKVEWRYILQPFCTTHGVLLRDAPVKYGTNEDYGLRLFMWHHSRDRKFDRYDLACEADSELLRLSFDVQQRYMDLRLRAPHSDVAQQIDNFMLTLMRAVLLPCFGASYRNVDMSGCGGPDCFPKHGQSFYVKFYFEVYRVSCSARARALYLSGLLLGWIEPSDAQAARGRDYYMVTDRAQIWRTIDKNSQFGRWLHKELESYESRLLALSDIGF